MAVSAEEVFRARCQARALLWQAGELDLHDAVDKLVPYAVQVGLETSLAQQIMANAFARVREQ